MPDNILPFADPDDEPLSPGDAERLIAAANDPFNKIFPPVAPLGEMIRDLRKARRMSQDQLAVAIGALRSQSHISAIERGEVVPDQDTIIRIADALEVDRAVLLRAREYGKPSAPGEFGVDPRLMMIWDRLAQFDPEILNAFIVVVDGFARFVEVVVKFYEEKKVE